MTFSGDDRIKCRPDCAHMGNFGMRCRTLETDQIVELPRRCEDFKPADGLPDRRTGNQRWPSLKRDRLAAVVAEKEAQRGGLGK